MSEHQKLLVELGDRSYPIVIGRGLMNGLFDLSDYIRGKDCLVVSDEAVAPVYLKRFLPNLGKREVASIIIPDGEVYKTLTTIRKILDELINCGANRDTTIIALGGGVVGDIAGFAAACYMRGVDFIQVPTTLLAQVDSSVGGKTGVNHKKGKNLIGAFHQPKLVLIDTDTLATLPKRQFVAGLAEVIKYGVIADEDFLKWIEANMPALLNKHPEAIAYAIRRSCELKAEVVAEDERESGRRAILNFGHTFGHAIERNVGYGEWLHGEAVAAGMVMAAELSGIAAQDLVRLIRLIKAAGLPFEPPALPADQWLEAMGMDKKVKDNKLRFVLIRSLGDAYVTNDYDTARLDALIGASR